MPLPTSLRAALYLGASGGPILVAGPNATLAASGQALAQRARRQADESPAGHYDLSRSPPVRPVGGWVGGQPAALHCCRAWGFRLTIRPTAALHAAPTLTAPTQEGVLDGVVVEQDGTLWALHSSRGAVQRCVRMRGPAGGGERAARSKQCF